MDDVPAAEVVQARARGFLATSDEAEIGPQDVIVICVPTPLSAADGPDLGAVRAAAEAAGRLLRPGTLVSLESTTYPGTTDEVVRPLLRPQPNLSKTTGYSVFLHAFEPFHSLTLVASLQHLMGLAVAVMIDLLLRRNGVPQRWATAATLPVLLDGFVIAVLQVRRHARGTAAPNLVTGCDVFFGAVGDLDWDGTSYYPDWPDSVVPDRFPSTFLQLQPTTNGGHRYPQIQFMTDTSASELNTNCDLNSGAGCVLPPQSPGHFFPYFTQARVGGACFWEFGNMRNGNTFGGDAQYGAVGPGTIGAFAGPVRSNPNC